MVQCVEDLSWLIAHKNQMCGMHCTESLIEQILKKRKQRVNIDLEKNQVKYIEANHSDEEELVMCEDKAIDWSAYDDM